MKILTAILFLGLGLSLVGCDYSRRFTSTYYEDNLGSLNSIRRTYKELYDGQPFSLELKDKYLNRIGLEIITDSIKYIYSFNLNESYLMDTLRKYRIDVSKMGDLILEMQKAHCTWITNLDYYENLRKKELLFISVRHKELEAFLKPEKYFTLALFNDDQPCDEKNRLLDKDGVQQLRRINGRVYRCIEPKVFYAVADSYR